MGIVESKNHISRREFIRPLAASGLVLGAMGPLGFLKACREPAGLSRRFHISLSSESIREYPELPSIVRDAGNTHAWIGTAHFGEFRTPLEELRKQADHIESLGMKADVITIPLGHPADPVGFAENPGARTMPSHWKNACTFDGELYSGTSLHPPAVEENAEAMRLLAQEGFNTAFVDDDFRLARYPGHIGGCFCDECRKEFTGKYGYGSGDWEDLLHSVENRVPSGVLESWIEFICGKLTGMFNAQREAAHEMDVGIMVMYLGAEKAGIELEHYRDVPFRVGELMFNDNSFGPIKGKTDELFSVLFHRRFTEPVKAYSETTIFPEGALSAKNLAAKLHISTISDVRNTMFMSGINPIPLDYWDTLAPVMRKSARQHEDIAGHSPRGPFRHFWGWDSRIVGRDRPFSLFLASGIPFEVAAEPGIEGWHFMSDEDARAVAQGRINIKNDKTVIRNSANLKGSDFIVMDESLEDIFAFKRKILPELKDIPYVDGEVPAVFAWYPTANRALIWNVTEEEQTCQVKMNNQSILNVTIGGLDSELVSLG